MNKSVCVALGLGLMTSFHAQAQLGEGGLPLSMQRSITTAWRPAIQYALPDWEAARNQYEKEAAVFSRPFQIGVPVDMDIQFPHSGTMVTLENGTRVWRTSVWVQGAPAIGLYYNEFFLPKGVRMHLTNDNGRQVLGAYTFKNNFDDGLFAHEAVQGEKVHLELNIEPDVDVSAIQLHVDRGLIYFRSYEYLNQYASDESVRARPTDEDPFNLEGSSSTCGINAICPLGVNYPIQRKSSVQFLLPAGGACSGTMINNTGNSEAECKPYLLTASHCEASSSVANSTFSQLLIRFNFEKLQCSGGAPATVNTLQGANFKARANYAEAVPPQINGDFLLLELRQPIPMAWDVYLSGWNRATTMPSPISYPKRYISFHHPGGDIKKVSASDDINAFGDAGGSLGPGSHWQIFNVDSGGIEPGSSGSGLFDGDGYLIGVTSVAGDEVMGCGTNGKGQPTLFFKYVAFSKMSVAWEYSVDGTNPINRLQPWLDPANTGAITLNPVKSNCTAASVAIDPVIRRDDMLDNAISLYPNPSASGQTTATINLADAKDLVVTLHSISGAKLKTYDLKNIKSGSYSFDLSQYANGMYLLKFSDGYNHTTKKIMLTNR